MKYTWTSKVSNIQYHNKEYLYTEETTDPVVRDILSEYDQRAIKLLESQGRHRSQWCYAPYDGRSWNGTKANKSKKNE